MKKSTRFFALCLALTMCATLAITGATGEAEQTAEPTSVTAEATAAPQETAETVKSPDDVLAYVNQQPVLRSDIQPILESFMYEYSSYGIDVASMGDYFESIALEYGIQDALWKQKAAENGFDQFTAEEITEFDTQAKDEWNAILDQNYTYFLTSESSEPTEQEIADAKGKVEEELAKIGYTLESMAKQLQTSKAQERTIESLMSDVQPYTDEEVQAEYEKRVAADKEAFELSISAYEEATSQGEESVWYVPEGIRGITHILLSVDSELLNNYLTAKADFESQQVQDQALEEENVDPFPEETKEDAAAEETAESTAIPEATPEPSPTPTPEPVTQADVDAARQAVLDSIKDKTDDIYARLAAGEPFAALVEQYGEDPGMQQEPYKSEGYSVHKDFQQFIGEFTQGAFAPELQKVGDYGQPIIGSYGVHILCYNRDVPSGPKELTDERKVSLTTDMEQTRRNDIINKAVDEWFASAEITYTGLVPKLED